MMHSYTLYIDSWERRVDPRGRVYYVDHNTRTTTWQRPNTDMVTNWHNWQEWRNNRTMDAMNRRFLFPQMPQPAENDPLGPLPEGWGKLPVLSYLILGFYLFSNLLVCISSLASYFIEICFQKKNAFVMLYNIFLHKIKHINISDSYNK